MLRQAGGAGPQRFSRFAVQAAQSYFGSRPDFVKLLMMVVTGLLGLNMMATAWCEGDLEENTLPEWHPVVQNFPCNGTGAVKAGFLLRHGVSAYPIFFLLKERDRWATLQHTFLIARLLFAAVAPIHAYSDYVHKLLNAVQRLMCTIFHLVLSFRAPEVVPSRSALWYLRMAPVIDVTSTGLFKLGFWGEALYGAVACVSVLWLSLRYAALHPHLAAQEGMRRPAVLAQQMASTVVLLFIESWRLRYERQRRRLLDQGSSAAAATAGGGAPQVHLSVLNGEGAGGAGGSSTGGAGKATGSAKGGSSSGKGGDAGDCCEDALYGTDEGASSQSEAVTDSDAKAGAAQPEGAGLQQLPVAVPAGEQEQLAAGNGGGNAIGSHTDTGMPLTTPAAVGAARSSDEGDVCCGGWPSSDQLLGAGGSSPLLTEEERSGGLSAQHPPVSSLEGSAAALTAAAGGTAAPPAPASAAGGPALLLLTAPGSGHSYEAHAGSTATVASAAAAVGHSGAAAAAAATAAAGAVPASARVLLSSPSTRQPSTWSAEPRRLQPVARAAAAPRPPAAVGRAIGAGSTAGRSLQRAAQPHAELNQDTAQQQDAGPVQRAPYIARTRLLTASIKIRGVDPSQVAAGYRQRIEQVLAGSRVQLEGVYLRAGCIELVVDVRAWRNANANIGSSTTQATLQSWSQMPQPREEGAAHADSASSDQPPASASVDSLLQQQALSGVGLDSSAAQQVDIGAIIRALGLPERTGAATAAEEVPAEDWDWDWAGAAAVGSGGLGHTCEWHVQTQGEHCTGAAGAGVGGDQRPCRSSWGDEATGATACQPQHQPQESSGAALADPAVPQVLSVSPRVITVMTAGSVDVRDDRTDRAGGVAAAAPAAATRQQLVRLQLHVLWDRIACVGAGGTSAGVGAGGDLPEVLVRCNDSVLPATVNYCGILGTSCADNRLVTDGAAPGSCLMPVPASTAECAPACAMDAEAEAVVPVVKDAVGMTGDAEPRMMRDSLPDSASDAVAACSTPGGGSSFSAATPARPLSGAFDGSSTVGGHSQAHGNINSRGASSYGGAGGSPGATYGRGPGSESACVGSVAAPAAVRSALVPTSADRPFDRRARSQPQPQTRPSQQQPQHLQLLPPMLHQPPQPFARTAAALAALAASTPVPQPVVLEVCVSFPEACLPDTPGLLLVEVRAPGKVAGTCLPVLLLDDHAAAAELQAAVEAAEAGGVGRGTAQEWDDVFYDMSYFLQHTHALTLPAAAALVAAAGACNGGGGSGGGHGSDGEEQEEQKQRVLVRELGMHLLGWLRSTPTGAVTLPYLYDRIQQGVASLDPGSDDDDLGAIVLGATATAGPVSAPLAPWREAVGDAGGGAGGGDTHTVGCDTPEPPHVMAAPRLGHSNQQLPLLPLAGGMVQGAAAAVPPQHQHQHQQHQAHDARARVSWAPRGAGAGAADSEAQEAPLSGAEQVVAAPAVECPELGSGGLAAVEAAGGSRLRKQHPVPDAAVAAGHGVPGVGVADSSGSRAAHMQVLRGWWALQPLVWQLPIWSNPDADGFCAFVAGYRLQLSNFATITVNISLLVFGLRTWKEAASTSDFLILMVPALLACGPSTLLAMLRLALRRLAPARAARYCDHIVSAEAYARHVGQIMAGFLIGCLHFPAAAGVAAHELSAGAFVGNAALHMALTLSPPWVGLVFVLLRIPVQGLLWLRLDPTMSTPWVAARAVYVALLSVAVNVACNTYLAAIYTSRIGWRKARKAE